MDSSTLIVAVIGALCTLTAGLLPYYLSNRKKRGQKYQLIYVRLMHLKKRGKGSNPVFQTFIKRLNKKIDVYDEFQMLNLNVFYKTQIGFKGNYRSSGIIDSFIYYPWHEKMSFSDKGASEIANYIEYTINQKSDNYLTKCIFYNGLQDGHEDIGTKMKYDTDETKLILDFSSLRSGEKFLITDPKSFHRNKNGVETSLGTTKIADGLFVTELKDGKQDEVIRMDLKINWDPIYLFAYGSLINEESARMVKEDRDISFQQTQARLHEYKRVWSISDDVYSENKRERLSVVFLNLEHDGITSVNGIIFPINDKELENLKIREKNYQLTDVTELISTSGAVEINSAKCKVYTFVGKPEHLIDSSKKVMVLKKYIDKIKTGCKTLGVKFSEEFDKTTEKCEFTEIEGNYYFLHEEQNKFT